MKLIETLQEATIGPITSRKLILNQKLDSMFNEMFTAMHQYAKEYIVSPEVMINVDTPLHGVDLNINRTSIYNMAMGISSKQFNWLFKVFFHGKLTKLDRPLYSDLLAKLVQMYIDIVNDYKVVVDIHNDELKSNRVFFTNPGFPLSTNDYTAKYNTLLKYNSDNSL